MLDLTKIAAAEMRENPVLGICMIGASITRLLSVLFSTYLILWIQTFVSGEQGNPRLVESREAGKTIYQNIMVISVLVSAFVFPFVGAASDYYSPKTMIPGAFLFRAFMTYLFSFVTDPNSWRSFIVSILMIIATIVENISVDTVFAKNLPKETRGLLNGIYSFAGQVGLLAFSVAGGWLFDNLGSKSPFYLIGILDFAYALLVLVLSRCGLFSVYESREKRSRDRELEKKKFSVYPNSQYSGPYQDRGGSRSPSLELFEFASQPMTKAQAMRSVGGDYASGDP